MDGLVLLQDVVADASHDNAPGCGVGGVVAIYLEGHPAADRGGELGPRPGSEDDAPVVDDVVDREDVWLTVDGDGQSTDDGLT